MKGIEINFNMESPQRKGQKIDIEILSPNENLLYKFFMGVDGVWSTLRNFDESKVCSWIPEKDGKYIIMVQAREKNSKKAFDYVTRADFIIGVEDEGLIKDVYINKEEFKVGDKINIMVETYKIPLMYKYWLKVDGGWEMAKDYCPENNLNLSANVSGNYEVLIECKEVDSKNNFDDFKKISFKVKDVGNIEIVNFKSLCSEFIVGQELSFQVDCKHEEDRMILYKFVKVDSKGNMKCIQDYSTSRIVSLTEKLSGDYRLLCMVKDMYSGRQYDDRALISYEVLPYKKVILKDFTTDLSSPQIIGSEVCLKAFAEGGNNLLYRFIIEGEYSEDSGYIKTNSFIWKSRKEGNYNLKVMVKDSSYEADFEDIKEVEYDINAKSLIPVKIKNIEVDGSKNNVKNKPINVRVSAEGGIELKYSFIVYKEGNEHECIEYGDCNWANFTPEESGEYELEIRVKDKYSDKDYDCHSKLLFNIKEYVPGNIDYVLLNSKEYYMVGDTIGVDVIAENTRSLLVKYILKVDNRLVEETDFIRNKKYAFTPKCIGSYTIEIQGKNRKCKEGYDSKKEIKVRVHDALPVTNTRLLCDKTSIYINEPVTFTATSEGGKDVLYEFYIMEQGEWRIIQKYSKKNFYGFMPFLEGNYKLLVLTKSNYKNCSYEDYDLLEFKAENFIKKPEEVIDCVL